MDQFLDIERVSVSKYLKEFLVIEFLRWKKKKKSVTILEFHRSEHKTSPPNPATVYLVQETFAVFFPHMP